MPLVGRNAHSLLLSGTTLQNLWPIQLVVPGTNLDLESTIHRVAQRVAHFDTAATNN